MNHIKAAYMGNRDVIFEEQYKLLKDIMNQYGLKYVVVGLDYLTLLQGGRVYTGEGMVYKNLGFTREAEARGG